MFGTCLNYVTLRLLGQVQKDENDGLAKGRAWILSHGTATAAPQWAKILLSRDTSRAGSSPRSNDHRVLCSALAHRADARARPCRKREGGRVTKEGREGSTQKPLPTKAGLHRGQICCGRALPDRFLQPPPRPANHRIELPPVTSSPTLGVTRMVVGGGAR
ncbi:hypothetical protein C2845_PM10G11450 [Panicum miliaceum]|uniref:Squalene cyclase N-terminal domain-containing protein n=1 Tax=Panicum miliaceum TaxID=4540 RepID=A0A3L6PCV6_PANMI|nr:hypothetical protein C2845_PM10G11450 [Panicum miliaceum]